MMSDMPDDLFSRVQPDIKARRDAEVPDVIPPTFVERALATLEREYGPLPPAPPVTGASIRASCRFCTGRGCLNCDTLAAEEYARQFPQGPQPIFTARFASEGDMAVLKAVFHQRELEAAYGKNGGGTQEILNNLREATKPPEDPQKEGV